MIFDEFEKELVGMFQGRDNYKLFLEGIITPGLELLVANQEREK